MERVKEKMEEAKGMDASIQCIAILLRGKIESDEKLREMFLRPEFTWEKMLDFVCHKAKEARDEKKKGAQVICASDATVAGWAAEFFQSEEIPPSVQTPTAKTKPKIEAPAPVKEKPNAPLPNQIGLGDISPEDEPEENPTEEEDPDDE